MTLIASISGIRGTIGGQPGTNLTPIDAARFAAAFAQFIRESSGNATPLVVIGRDARPSGQWLNGIVVSTLQACGIHVVDLSMCSTPTVEVAVVGLQADGGIVLTASHNPMEWNALKLLNSKGEFISAAEGGILLSYVRNGNFSFPSVNDTGKLTHDDTWTDRHIELICKHPLVKVDAIRNARLHVLIDPVNSVGAISVPALLDRLGVRHSMINGVPNGFFAHNPEPLREHLDEICSMMETGSFDLGIVVDPDVDRLALVTEEGLMFGEEYTLVAVADYVLKHRGGAVVNNLSSSRALADLAEQYGQVCYSAAVGEVNVVSEMKRVGAVIGGEGNGGIIVPDLHYGRDALAGIALVLSLLALEKVKLSDLRRKYPEYYMSKNKVLLGAQVDPETILDALASNYRDQRISTVDGLKIDFDNCWVHLRKSNTEPIIRIYSEAKTQIEADELSARFNSELLETAS